MRIYSRDGTRLDNDSMSAQERCQFLDALNSAQTVNDFNVARTELANGKLIFTVFIRIDFSESKNPKLFETIVFGPRDSNGRREQLSVAMYATEKEALEGHDKAVRQWTKQD